MFAVTWRGSSAAINVLIDRRNCLHCWQLINVFSSLSVDCRWPFYRIRFFCTIVNCHSALYAIVCINGKILARNFVGKCWDNDRNWKIVPGETAITSLGQIVVFLHAIDWKVITLPPHHAMPCALPFFGKRKSEKKVPPFAVTHDYGNWACLKRLSQLQLYMNAFLFQCKNGNLHLQVVDVYNRAYNYALLRKRD